MARITYDVKRLSNGDDTENKGSEPFYSRRDAVSTALMLSNYDPTHRYEMRDHQTDTLLLIVERGAIIPGSGTEA